MEYQDISTRIPKSSTGIYIAYPTSTQIKPVYPGYKTLVNSEDTKVGIARRSFESREKQYHKTFQTQILFFPVLELPPDKLQYFEKQLLDLILRKFSRSGRAREWFRTTDRQQLAEMVWSLRPGSR